MIAEGSTHHHAYHNEWHIGSQHRCTGLKLDGERQTLAHGRRVHAEIDVRDHARDVSMLVGSARHAQSTNEARRARAHIAQGCCNCHGGHQLLVVQNFHALSEQRHLYFYDAFDL